MADDVVRPRLGRGLAALIGDFGDEGADATKSQAQRKVAVEFLRPNPRNPRRRGVACGLRPPPTSHSPIGIRGSREGLRHQRNWKEGGSRLQERGILRTR